MQDFRNIEVWQVAHKFALNLYRVTSHFPDNERYGITSQLRRACVSISANIAEGCVRSTDADFARFLYNSMGSASEVEYLLLLSHELGYLADEVFKSLSGDVRKIKRMLAAFIRTLKTDNSFLPKADSR